MIEGTIYKECLKVYGDVCEGKSLCDILKEVKNKRYHPLLAILIKRCDPEYIANLADNDLVSTRSKLYSHKKRFHSFYEMLEKERVSSILEESAQRLPHDSLRFVKKFKNALLCPVDELPILMDDKNTTIRDLVKYRLEISF